MCVEIDDDDVYEEKRRDWGFLKEEIRGRVFRLGMTLFLRPLDWFLSDGSAIVTQLCPPLDLF